MGFHILRPGQCGSLRRLEDGTLVNDSRDAPLLFGAQPCEMPALTVACRTIRPPANSLEMADRIGDQLASLWWVQRTIKGKNPMVDVFRSMDCTQRRVRPWIDQFRLDFRSANSQSYPELCGRAVTSYNEFASDAVSDRAVALSKFGSPEGLVEQIESIRRMWRFEEIDCADLATRCQLEASRLTADVGHRGSSGQSKESHDDDPGDDLRRHRPVPTWPPDDGWHFRPGEVAFRGRKTKALQRESRILQCLVAAKGPVTRQTFLDEAWDVPEPVITDSALPTQIFRARKVLEALFPEIGEEDPIPCVQRGMHAAWRLNAELLEKIEI